MGTIIDIFGSGDPKKPNNNIDPESVNIPSNDDNMERYQDVKERSQEINSQQQEDFLRKTEQQQYGDPTKANANPNDAFVRNRFSSESLEYSRDRHIEGERAAKDLEDIHQTWLGEIGKGIMRGIGRDVVGGTGDVLNFVGAGLGINSMIEGNILSRPLNAMGTEIEDENTTFLKQKMQGKEITWASLADKNFWTTNVSEMIPMALEFLAMGMGAGAAAEKGAGWFTRNALGGVARKFGRVAVTDTATAMATGVESMVDVMGTGSKIGGALLRNAGGVAEMTELSKNFISMAGGAVSSNFLSGAMNAMDLHKQMQAENKARKDSGLQPLYTEEDMAQAAAGSFNNNLYYLPIDFLSWGINYGKAFEKMGAAMIPPRVKPALQLLADSKNSFGYGVRPFIGAIGKLGGAVAHGLSEGFEEQFQETYEDWAKLKARAKVTGEQAPGYWEFFHSKQNEGTRVAAFAMGALMGTATNVKGAFNKNAENAFNYYDRNQMLRASIDVENKKGQEYKRWHINNTMLDLHASTLEDKRDAFDKFIIAQVANGNLQEEEVKGMKDVFDAIGEDFSKATNLNIAGKEALMRSTIGSKFMLESIENDKAELADKLQMVDETYPEGEDREAARRKITDDYQETMDTKAIIAAMHEQNRQNLILGKKASPVNMEFIVHSNGKERILLTEHLEGLELKEALEGGGILAGLSDEQYEQYVNKSTDDIYAEAREMNKSAKKRFGTRAREFYNKIKPDAKGEAEVKVDENGNPIAADDTNTENPDNGDTATPTPVDSNNPNGPNPPGNGVSATTEEKAKIQEEIAANRERKNEIRQQLADDDTVAATPAKSYTVVESKKNGFAVTTGEQSDYVTDKNGQVTWHKTSEEAHAQKKALEEADAAAPPADADSKKKMDPKQRQALEDELSKLDEAESNLKKKPRTTDANDPANKRKDDENPFEEYMVDAEDIADEKKKTLAEHEAENIRKAEEEFKKQKAGKPAAEEQQTEHTVNNDGKSITVLDPDGNPVLRADGKPRKYPNEGIARRAAADLNEKARGAHGGKASIVGWIGRGIKNKLFGRSSQKAAGSLSAEEQNQQAMSINRAQAALRRGIIQKTHNDFHGTSASANPTVTVSKNELDAYLDSAIAKFQYGPSQIDKQIAINRSLKKQGLNVSVIAAQNLFDAVGIDAVGYSIASTIFIDEKVWEQPEVFHHEMSHIYYRAGKDSDATKAVINEGYKNTGLVDKVYRDYAEHVRYDFYDENDQLTPMSFTELFASQGMNIFEGIDSLIVNPDPNATMHEIMTELAKNYFGELKVSDQQHQEYVNEEIFAFTMQGPMSKKYNNFYEQTGEFGRRKVNKGFWAHLKGQEITYTQSKLDIAKMLNNGQSVPQADLFDFVMKGFRETVKEGSLTTEGFASRVAGKTIADIKAANEISKDKVAQQAIMNATEMTQRYRQQHRDRTIDKIRREIREQGVLTPDQEQMAINSAIEEWELNAMEGGAYDDYEMAKSLVFRGATRILNSFTKSLNYVKRQRFLKNPENFHADFDPSQHLVDRDALISEIFNLAFETKGNTNEFIKQIENSPIQEISMFNTYMDKMYPAEKRAILNSMGMVMANNQTISAIKGYVNQNNEYVMENALSETEKNKVDYHMNFLAQQQNSDSAIKQEFQLAHVRIDKGTQSNADYLTILRTLAPMGVRYSALVKADNINVRGTTGSVRYVIDNAVRHKSFLDSNGHLDLNKARPFVEAVIDSNRRYTSYSVVQNAQGNFEPSKITNNHLLSETNKMVKFLSKKVNGKRPSFQAFKKEFGHINDPKGRTLENPILRNIYDQFQKGNTVPSITQYMGLKHAYAQKNMLYKESTDFTQTVEDFLMFNSNSAEYQQTLGAFADSPRKFYFSAPRHKVGEMFKGKELTLAGRKQLRTAFTIYEGLNKNLSPEKRAEQKIIETYDDFEKAFEQEVQKEISRWNENGADLQGMKNLNNPKSAKANLIEYGKLTAAGQAKIREFVFNQVVNGMALSEIFNPGVSVNELTKRNKGNSSPVVSIGNENLKMEPLFVRDTDEKGNDRTDTNAGMYMTRQQADRIIKAGLGVMDMNNGLKMLNYSIERNNPNFAHRAAYFKGYTTIIDEETLKTEPGLRGTYEMLLEREAMYEQQHFKKYGEYPSEDLLDGKPNFINFAVPYTAIKSDLLTAEQKSMFDNFTYEALNDAHSSGEGFGRYHETMNKMFNDEKGEFMGMSAYNFGPQQIMDKVTKEAPTPVQFMTALVVNGSTMGTLAKAEEIQKLIRADMTDNLDEIIRELKGMDPKSYKDFIMSKMDLENMDQGQRLIMQEGLTNLNHTAIEEFVTNTLANNLKFAANKLKTSGTIAQQKPSAHYRLPNGYRVNGSARMAGYSDRYNADGSKGSNVMEIVLPKHMTESGVRARTYLAIGSKEVTDLLEKNKALKSEYEKGDNAAKLEVIKALAQKEALHRHEGGKDPRGFGFKVSDSIGLFEDQNGPAGYFVRGDNVLASRIPSHGPSCTGVFEVIDFHKGEGNQTIVHEDFTDVIGADYDGDSLFIQTKGKNTPNFNKALDKTVELWTSPEMYEQIRAKMEYKDKVKKILANNKTEVENNFPLSPGYHRNAFNNTMVSKRSIGIVLNMHRMANYLAAYKVGVVSPITIDGISKIGFSDDQVGVESRNNQSAMLANIILDNAKDHYADKLGLNDQTINQFVLMINMGFDLATVSKIMNSTAVKSWVKHNKNSQSPFTERMNKKDVSDAIYKDLGLAKTKTPSLFIDTKNMETTQQKQNIINLMENLAKMNEELQKVGKIMAGHNGIESNPFILERQLAEFNKVMNNQVYRGTLSFGDNFRNNPDIKAYHDNAERILEVMKKANKIYSKSTSEIIDRLNTKLNYDGLNEFQLKRISEQLHRFMNSRILGLNNISAEEKEKMKTELFRDLDSYYDSMIDTEVDGRTGIEKSILFQRALNVKLAMEEENGKKSEPYLSANPRFFNESLGEEEKRAVQREFVELPQDLKDKMIVYDLMKNGLTGPLSLAHVFDQRLNADISEEGLFQQQEKDKALSPAVVSQLENLLISDELKSKYPNIPIIRTNEKFEDDQAVDMVEKMNRGLYYKMKKGEPTIFKIGDKFYEFSGFPNTESVRIVQKNNRGHQDQAFRGLIRKLVKPYIPMDVNIAAEVISIADKTVRQPYKTRKSHFTDNKADHIVQANLNEVQKKKHGGKFLREDVHNFSDVREMSRGEFDLAMQYKHNLDEEQRQIMYEIYQNDKAEANQLIDRINAKSVLAMTDDKLKSLYEQYARKDMYAYSVITTPIILEMANRAAAEQSRITGKWETGKDMSVIGSWLDNNNIPSDHPATQSLVRQISTEYKNFVRERGGYVKQINEVTEALYKEKFGLSDNKIVATIQKVKKALFDNRANLYEQLYGNLVEVNEIKLPEGKTRKEFKFREQADIDADHRAGTISDAEYDFYNTFREITKELEPYGSDGKKRRDYIPHTAMNTFEVFAHKGLLGVMVNSRGEEDVLGDVKVYATINGNKELLSFRDIKNNYNAMASNGNNGMGETLEFLKLKRRAKKMLKEGKNEDGSALELGSIQNATLMDMGPMSRFAHARSVKAEEMPSMDLNKALIDYVHSTLFANGNGNFQGFKKMMPLIDGVMAYNDKRGFKNAYKYTKEVFKDKFIQKKDQDLLGPTGDKVVNGLVKGNLLYALGYKGIIVGKALYAIGNVTIGKYMNIKREGGQAWLNGELRYWGTDKGFGIDALSRRRRASKILSNLGFMELDIHDDVSIQSKTGLDGIFTKLALLPIAATEDWIQKAHFLGMLSEEEWNKFDDEGNFKPGETFDQKRLMELEERIKLSQGKGYTPTDISRLQTYSVGRMFLQFSRHIPANIRERFSKEDIDAFGNKHVGSLRQMYSTVSAIMANQMSPAQFKEYYKSLDPHQKEALLAGLRGMSMVALLGFIGGQVADGTTSDANIYSNVEKMAYKMVPPVVHSGISLMKGLGNSDDGNVLTIQ